MLGLCVLSHICGGDPKTLNRASIYTEFDKRGETFKWKEAMTLKHPRTGERTQYPPYILLVPGGLL